MGRWGRVIRNLRLLGQRESGAALIEMAVVVPMVLLIAVGVADYSRVYATAIAVTNAAKAGAQYGVQSNFQTGDTAQINTAARQDGLDAGSMTVTSSRVCRCSNGSTVNCITGTCGTYGVPQVYVACTATKSVPLLFKYPGIPTTISVARTATLRSQ